MDIISPKQLVSLTTFVVDHDNEQVERIYQRLTQLGLSCERISQAPDLFTKLPLVQGGCVLMDVRLPFYSGVELQRLLQQHDPHLPIIFMGHEQDIQVAINVLKAGAFDFLLKPLDEQLLLDVINRALRKRLEQLKKQQFLQKVQKQLKDLSNRESEVLQHVLAGLPNKKIALQLKISSKTVEQHRANIMRKMQANSLAELVTTVVSYNLA